MHPALVAVLVVVLVTVWFGYSAFRLKYRNASRRRHLGSFRPKWSSGRRHRSRAQRFGRRAL